MKANREADNNSTAEWCVSQLRNAAALSKEAKNSDCKGRYTLSVKLSDFTV